LQTCGYSSQNKLAYFQKPITQFIENMDIMRNVLYQKMLLFLLMVIAMVCTQHDLTFAMGAIF
jgi:hypothetical protein